MVTTPLNHNYHARRLKLADPRVVEKYLPYLYSAMQDHDIFQKMEDIHNVAIYSLTEITIERGGG